MCNLCPPQNRYSGGQLAVCPINFLSSVLECFDILYGELKAAYQQMRWFTNNTSSGLKQVLLLLCARLNHWGYMNTEF